VNPGVRSKLVGL